MTTFDTAAWKWLSTLWSPGQEPVQALRRGWAGQVHAQQTEGQETAGWGPGAPAGLRSLRLCREEEGRQKLARGELETLSLPLSV